MTGKIIFNLIAMGVFFILFSTLGSADLYLNSKTGSIYFNTSGISRASIGPGGNFSINIENSDDCILFCSEFSKVQFLEDGERIVHTSDFFVNQKNLEFGFIKNKLVFECAQESGDSRHLDDRRADLMRHDRHVKVSEDYFEHPKVLTTLQEGLFDNNLGRVGIGGEIDK